MSSPNVEPTILTSSQLEKQLARALRNDPTREGSFAFGTTMHSAPNPGLEIDSLGMLGLPLSPRDMESIKGIASRAPFGHGEKSIIDSTVRDTWEIDSSRISLKNSSWTSFLGGVVDTVWKGLGVAPFTTRPRCELYKLLLYETGSQYVVAFVLIVGLTDCKLSSFLPHQEWVQLRICATRRDTYLTL